jgi:hypothetical protein
VVSDLTRGAKKREEKSFSAPPQIRADSKFPHAREFAAKSFQVMKTGEKLSCFFGAPLYISCFAV